MDGEKLRRPESEPEDDEDEEDDDEEDVVSRRVRLCLRTFLEAFRFLRCSEGCGSASTTRRVADGGISSAR